MRDDLLFSITREGGQYILRLIDRATGRELRAEPWTTRAQAWGRATALQLRGVGAS